MRIIGLRAGMLAAVLACGSAGQAAAETPAAPAAAPNVVVIAISVVTQPEWPSGMHSGPERIPSIGSMAGFISTSVGFAAPTALAAIAFGKYVAAAWPGLPPKECSVLVVLVLAGLHSVTVRASGNFQVVFTSLKIALILVFIALGFWKEGSGVFPAGQADFSLVLSGPFAVSLMFVLYSYSGWNAAAYIMSEVRDPQRTVPWALPLATAIVTVLYVVLNAVFLASGPIKDFAGHIEVGEISARHLLGESGGRFMSALIGFGLISAISAMTWTGPRVMQTIGRDFDRLRFLSRTSHGGVPHYALILQTVLVLIMILTATFEAVLVYAQMALLTSSFLAVLGVFVLRRRQPDLSRPFRCPGYPVTPLIFLVLNAFAIIYSAKEQPVQAAAGAGTLVAGIGLYFLVRNRKITA